MTIEADEAEKKSDKLNQLIGASALIPLICALSQPPDYRALIYTIFVTVYLFNHRPAGRNNENFNRFEFALLFISSGLIVQLLDYISYLNISTIVEASQSSFEANLAATGIAPDVMQNQLHSSALSSVNDSVQDAVQKRAADALPVWRPQWPAYINVGDTMNIFTRTAAALAVMAGSWLLAMKAGAFSYREGILLAILSGLAISITTMMIAPAPGAGSVTLTASLLSLSLTIFSNTVCYASIAGIALTAFKQEPAKEIDQKSGQKSRQETGQESGQETGQAFGNKMPSTASTSTINNALVKRYAVATVALAAVANLAVIVLRG